MRAGLAESRLSSGQRRVVQSFGERFKKKALEKGQGEIEINQTRYKVDGEVGRFDFSTHSTEKDGLTTYNTASSLFPALNGKEMYKTTGFKEIAIVYGTTENSFRRTADLINRVRHQEGATPSRTVEDNTEREGARAIDFLERKTDKILAENDFSVDGTPKKESKEYDGKIETLPKDKIRAAIDELELDADEEAEINDNPVDYEDPERSVNISIDDVVVKRQKEKRKKDASDAEEKPKKKKYVHNTVSHIQKGEKSYVVVGRGIAAVLRILLGFLINNDLLKFQLVFFIDGHKPLRSAILNAFRWFGKLVVVLDWYHLEKKCKMQLSLAMKGRKIRNGLLDGLLPILWKGTVDKALGHLENVDPAGIKDEEAFGRLVGYLKRNKATIPCYEVRKKLGLRNSSNIGEKMNDLLVSDRQKHNGMSWSKSGSVSLAALTAIKRNKEYDQWFEKGEIELKLVA